MIVNDDSRVVRMMLQVVASHTTVILMTLDLLFMFLENIKSTGITHDRHLQLSKYFYRTGHSLTYKEFCIRAL